MNNSLTTAENFQRCCNCHRLLCTVDDGAIAGTIRIKCGRCKEVNILRPNRAPTIERQVRQTERRA